MRICTAEATNYYLMPEHTTRQDSLQKWIKKIIKKKKNLDSFNAVL